MNHCHNITIRDNDEYLQAKRAQGAPCQGGSLPYDKKSVQYVKSRKSDRVNKYQTARTTETFMPETVIALKTITVSTPATQRCPSLLDCQRGILLTHISLGSVRCLFQYKRSSIVPRLMVAFFGPHPPPYPTHSRLIPLLKTSLLVILGHQ